MTDDTLPMLDIGSISHGTLRSEDLASALLDFAEYFDADMRADLERIAAAESEEDWDSEVINDAIDALQEHAPPYCYVGFHEGDGSDLGVWFNHDVFEEDCRSGDILKISDLAELDDMSPADFSAEYIALVNDHGNVTLYRPRIAVSEIWGIV